MTDYTELKRLADELIAANDRFNESPQDNEVGDVWSLANDRFTEAASPEVILALIAQIERDELALRAFSSVAETAVAERDRLSAEVAGLKTGYEAYERVNAELKAENEALRKECDVRHPFKPFHEPAIGFTGCVICGVYADHGGLPCPKTRATADAALGKGGQS